MSSVNPPIRSSIVAVPPKVMVTSAGGAAGSAMDDALPRHPRW
ncbi:MULTISPECIES: hypothetical protein [unclassified Blastococcus]|nr:MULTISPECIES: hypothetical protein [unclassified Blastococcus]